MITSTNWAIIGRDMRPRHATCFSKYDGYKAVDDHSDVTLVDDNEINNKYDEITNNKITHIDYGCKLIVFDDETNHKVEIVFYDTSSSENVTTTDKDVDYGLGVLDAKIYSIHALHKEPDETHIAEEEAIKEINIDAFINDMNHFLLST